MWLGDSFWIFHLVGSSDESFPVTDSNFEDLLEKDDDITWETDKLLLEISEALDDNNCTSSTSSLTEQSSVGIHSALENRSRGIETEAASLSELKDEANANVESEEARLCPLPQNNKLLTCSLSEAEFPTSLAVDEFGFPLAIFTKV